MTLNDLLVKSDICKNIIDKERPFEGNLLDQVKNFYRVSTTWSSNALEGNTLSLSETKVLLEDGITVAGKPLKDILEASGHARAYDYMFSLLHKREITLENIQQFHSLFYSGIDTENAGQYRKTMVLISGSNYPVSKVDEIEKAMEDMIKNINDMREKNIMHPIELAAELHRQLVYIHPFIDGNGRTARLAMNTLLIQEGYLPCVITPVVRGDYISSLEIAHKKPDIFHKFIADQEVETMKDFIRSMELERPNFPKVQENQNEYREDYMNDLER